MTMAREVQAAATPIRSSYEALLDLFKNWREFERPPMREGAPDYTASTLARRHQELNIYRSRLRALDPRAWPVEQQVDYQLLHAEMNGFDFNVRVLRPWARDPAFYKTVWTTQSDTPAHEGPVHHGLLELWQYSFPLTDRAERRLTAELRVIPPLLAQARANLTGSARDLWLAGIRTARGQLTDLTALERQLTEAGPEAKLAVQAARNATSDFVSWLEREAPSKNRSSGIGEEHYTWLRQHVHLVPLTWSAEVAIVRRELARAHAALRLEQNRNQDLAPLSLITNPAEFRRRGNAAVTKYLAFLQKKDILTVHEYMDSAMRERIGEYVPEEQRDFFAMATHREPLTLYLHFYHWWDLARMREYPHASPLRRGALLYNIWDSRAEGVATAMEELMLHAGLFDDNPRAREIIWVMLAQRAARGLASLYAHANMISLEEAEQYQVDWTPLGWMRPDLPLLAFEQQLYLRQPGYGSSYITGKYLIEELLQQRSRQLGASFTLRRFFDEVNDAGMIPVSLIRWQITGMRGVGL